MRKDGWIYAIGAEGSPYVKIGSTKGPVESRRKQLQTGHPLRLQTLAAVAVDADVQAIETVVQDFLVEHLQGGEWFTVSMDTERLAALVTRAIQWLEEQGKSPTPDPLIKGMGDRIRGVRARKRLNQAELARMIGISPNAMNAIEADEVDPRASRVLRIAQILGVSTDYLFGHTVKRKTRPPGEGVESELFPAAVA